MKHPAFAISVALLLSSISPALCEETDSDVNIQDSTASSMVATYVGAFGNRKITVCIDRVIGSTITGYSIVAGNERAFSGSWKESVDGYSITAKEPGDHPADGTFTFTFTADPKSIRGKWTANDKKIGVREFDLPARVFAYNPKAGKYPQTSSRLLSEKEVENLKAEELRIMRNEIYARHGYGFKLADMREYFDKIDWYMPIAVDITNKLSKIETKNAELIKRYENYSAEYYDSFGR